DAAIVGTAATAQQVAGADFRLAGIIRDVRRGGVAAVARADRLIDVGVMGDGALKAGRVAETAFAHHPGNEGGRPGVAPARGDAAVFPGLVLAFQNPGAAGRRRPVAADGSGDAFGLHRIEDRKSTRLNSSHVKISY